jgi:Pectinacetylesterase
MVHQFGVCLGRPATAARCMRTAIASLIWFVLSACGSGSETGTNAVAGGSNSGGATTTTGTAGSSSGQGGSGPATGPGTGGSTTGSGGSGGAGGSSGEGPTINVPPGDPITAPPMTWTAVPVAGSICRDGRPTGFGVNIATGSDKLLIYLEGGGACFNATTCAQAPSSWAATDANLGSRVRLYNLLDRNGTGPFKDWNLVFVPYCSGDVFTGTAMSGYMGQPQMGYSNFFKYLQRIIATFKGLSQVVLSGSSAGGFGIAWNWMLTQDAFGTVPVFALDDSGPPMSADYLSPCQEQRVAKLWGWADALHPACTGCDAANGKVVRPLLQTSLARAKGKRFALLSYDEDGVIKTFFAYGLNNCANWDSLLPPAYPAGKYPQGLAELRQVWAGAPDAAMYVVRGGGHTFLGSDLSRIQATTTSASMLDWVKQFVDKGSGWSNVTP